MATRTRFQWPTVGDTVSLEMYNYSNNLPADVTVTGISIYRVNNELISDVNPLGLVLYAGPFVPMRLAQGQYRLDLDLDPGMFNTGDFKDIWNITYPDGSSGQRDFGFHVYAQRQAAVTYPPYVSWEVSTSPRKVRYDSVFRLACRVKPSEIVDNDLAEHYVNMLTAGTVEIRLIKTSSVYDYVSCENGGDDDVNASLQWTPIEDRGDGVRFILIDTSNNGLVMYPGEYEIQFRITFGDTVWYPTEKPMLQITR